MENSKKKILLCEDDNNLGLMIKDYLESNNFEVVLEKDGRAGWSAFQHSKFDVCILDVMMPNIDGFTLAERIREQDGDVILFFLTAKTLIEDKRKAYTLEADDYISKPFDPEELLLKINAKIRRLDENKNDHAGGNYNLGKIIFNPRLRTLIYENQSSTLSPKENELLKLLVDNINDLVPREKALKKIWGSDSYFNGRSMDVYIAKLRKILKTESNLEIVNIHGEGFRLIEIKSTK